MTGTGLVSEMLDANRGAGADRGGIRGAGAGAGAGAGGFRSWTIVVGTRPATTTE